MAAAFDIYKAYSRAVQAPAEDVPFLRRVYREVTGAEPRSFREDFCGGFANCCEWVKLDKSYTAVGLDIDPEPIAYGNKHYLSALDKDAARRITILQRDVLAAPKTSSDIVCALNFSYSIFKDRPTLLRYFTRVYEGLSKGGVFILDNFGGPDCFFANTETRKFPDFTYEFEQTYLDPINNYAKFAIHFTPKGKKRIKNAFTYDWRLWSIPEIKDLLIEAGFKDAVVYWEGTAADGSGNGVYRKRAKGDECYVWLSYVVGCK